MLAEKSVRKKLNSLDGFIQSALECPEEIEIPLVPGRDIEVCAMSHLPPKPGLSKPEGQARLLHDLASIELQAMELGFRTLVEFSDESQPKFKEQLIEVILDEARHLRLCLDQIEDLGFQWGRWPTHIGLWTCVSKEDTFAERLLIVHRYLEGSGLDASDKILRRLAGTSDSRATLVVKTIAEEEIGHVLFGSNWFRRTCEDNHADPNREFGRILGEVFPRLPRRLEKINRDIRIQAGFNDFEIEQLKFVQSKQMT